MSVTTGTTEPEQCSASTSVGRLRRRWAVGVLAPARLTLFLWASAATVWVSFFTAERAEAAQTGQLEGVVVDENGEPLKDVRVILQSPQMIGGLREGVTDAEGAFRFPALDPGRYTVTLSSPTTVGFEEKDIYVGIDDHVTRDYVLEKAVSSGGDQKVIKVTATRPMVDTSRVSQGTSITPELTDRTATSRTYQGVALLTAGTSDGGEASGNPSVHGGTPFSNVYLLDGLNITDPVTQTFSTNFNFDAIGELEVMTGGLDAEYGSTTGGMLNIVTKSGGDDFEFDGSVYSAPRELQWLDAGEVNDSNTTTANLSVGGPIIRKKLWFFLSGQFIDSTSSQPVQNSPFGADFVLPPQRFLAFYGLGKLKWQVTPWQKLTLLMQGDPTTITNERQDQSVSPAAERQRYQGGVKIVATSETVLSDDLFWKTQIGYGADQIYVYPMSCGDDFMECALASTPGRTNLATGTATINDDVLADDRRYRMIAGSSLSYFHDGLLGDHEVKVGAEGTVTINATKEWVPGGMTYNDDGVSQPGSTVDGVGDPYQRTVYPEALNKTVSANLVSLYLQDTWRPLKGFTLRPGLRFDSSRGYRDAAEGGDAVFEFNSLSPRIGAAWDPLGDGKTVIRAGYYLYNETGLLFVPSFVGRTLQSRTYGYNPSTGKYDVFVRQSGGDSGYLAKDAMVPPNMHEVVFGVQRELAANTSLAVDFTYRRRQNMFEDDESNLIWNQRGNDVLGYRNNQPTVIYSVGTPAESMGQYVGVDFVLDKRLADDWQALVTYTLSRLEGTNESFVTTAFDNPTQRPYEYGFLADDIRHKLRTTLSYDLPYGLQVGATASYDSGRPLTKLFLNQFYGDYTDKRAPSGFDPKDVDDPDDDVPFRSPDTFVVDARVAWRLRDLTTQDIWLLVDVFNLLNTRPPVDLEVRDLPAGAATQFGDVLGRGGPLNAQFALRYLF
jgi:hypothetical protein